MDMTCEAILKACDDAGISVKDLDGFAYYSGASAGYAGKFDTGLIMETLGIPNVSFTATLTSGGGGSAGAVGLATAGLMNEDCKYAVTVMTCQQYKGRLGKVFGAAEPTPEGSFAQPAGLVGPGHLMSVLARRHMHLYGTTQDAFGEIVLASRENALNRPKAIRRTPLTKAEYEASPMLADPLRRLDFCLETDGAIAVITTTTDRARDCRQPPALIHACAHGASRDWGRAFTWMGMPDPEFSSSGHRFSADRIWQQSGLRAQDMDVALLYDHFSSMVLMQLEDYGFCERGEGNDYVLAGKTRFDREKGTGVNGGVPVNTHGGHLSEAYIIGMTHLVEAVEQIRGTAINQVTDAELALVTGGPAPVPVSSLVLRRA
jgi:acetyl-CoA acetyltransferase